MLHKTFLPFLLLFHLQTSTSQEFQKLKETYNDIQSVFSNFINAPSHINDIMEYHWEPTEEKQRPQYDFIIVGSGSAGAVLANRLSEISHWRILLLEAGKGENILSQVPVAVSALQFTHYNWNYFMEYQPNMCTGLNNYRMAWPRGRALGGTTVINYMIYTRGNRHDYDRWAQQGNPGWSYKDVLPYFIKSERAKLQQANQNLHGHNGELSVEDIYQSATVKAFVDSAPELNLTHIDYNANLQSFGFGTVQATVRNGVRHSHATAFLKPIRHKRANLDILTSAFVTKLLISPHTKNAYGVQYRRNGIDYEVHASKEVILSAGAFNSPQLLMLAGIGPKDHLQELGIPLLKDLPVGQNLHDHLTFVGLTFILDAPVTLSIDRLISPRTVMDFLANGTGPWTSLGGVEGIGYIKTELSQDPDPRPDIELIFLGTTLSLDYGIVTRRGMNIRDDVYNSLYLPTHNLPTWSIFPMLLHPKSTGYLKLQSTNPFDYPLFYGNFFTDPEQQDINTFVAAIRFIQKISNTTPFRKLGSRLNRNRIPGCEAFAFDSDDYWRCALRALSITLHHQVGTAKMGPADDPTSVVNHELKVHGIGHLRVADCSVIPFALGAHTNAPSTMIGEKAADLIKQSWGQLKQQ